MNKKLEILLAEDSSDDLELIRMALSKDNLPGTFHIVRNGQEAIDYLKGQGKFENRSTYPFPDLMVLDVKMPQVTGFEALQWLRNHPACASMPVVMLSGSESKEDIEQAYRLGANSYFSKPPTVNALTALLRALVHYWWLCERPMSPGACN
jgi:CheY-like chemotaxis protein